MTQIRFPVDADKKEQIIELAEFVGVPLNWRRDPACSYQWNGKDIACKNQCASNIVHDIAHWILAKPKYRLQKDFGLGTGPDSKYISFWADHPDPDAEEERVSALGIWFEKQFGWDWENTAEFHQWNEPEYIKRLGTIEEFWKNHKKNLYGYKVLFRSRR